jgi:hypothetical protein
MRRSTREQEIVNESDALRRLADRMEREGMDAMATLLRNAVYVLDGGSLEDYEWARGLRDANRPS